MSNARGVHVFMMPVLRPCQAQTRECYQTRTPDTPVPCESAVALALSFRAVALPMLYFRDRDRRMELLNLRGLVYGNFGITF